MPTLRQSERPEAIARAKALPIRKPYVARFDPLRLRDEKLMAVALDMTTVGRFADMASRQAEQAMLALAAKRLIELTATGAFLEMTEAGRLLVAGEARAAS